ncbi:MAG: hypothetical protein ACI9K9_001936, partial [Neolewinella sp.]
GGYQRFLRPRAGSSKPESNQITVYTTIGHVR